MPFEEKVYRLSDELSFRNSIKSVLGSEPMGLNSRAELSELNWATPSHSNT